MSFETGEFQGVIPRAYVAAGDESLPNSCDASGNLNVNVAAGSVSVAAAAADTAAQNTVTVATTATKLVDANANRTSLIFYNAGSNTIFFGPSGVTTSTGIPIAAGGIFTWGAGEDNTEIHGVVAAATEDMIVREIDNA